MGFGTTKKQTAFPLLLLVAVTACSASVAKQPNLAPACTEAIGMSARLSALQVGEQKVLFSVFPQGTAGGARATGPAPAVQTRFFRQITESTELSQPGQELRLYAPESTPVAIPNAEPISTPFGIVRDVHAYEVAVAFDKPGGWGVEVVVRAPWQVSPATTTLLFQVAPPAAPVASIAPAQPGQLLYFGPCYGIHRAPPPDAHRG